jgi:succinate dehydrogenase / fumarate reductase flavoprotein subunit
VQLRSRRAIAAAHDELNAVLREGEELARRLQRALRDAMWEGCGVVRDAGRLGRALARIGELKEAAGAVDVRPSSEGYLDLAVALDLRAALLSAEATVRGALARRESRGAHQRADYPRLDPTLTVSFRTRLRGEGGLEGGLGGERELETEAVPVPPVPEDLRALTAAEPELSLAGRLLE